MAFNLEDEFQKCIDELYAQVSKKQFIGLLTEQQAQELYQEIEHRLTITDTTDVSLTISNTSQLPMSLTPFQPAINVSIQEPYKYTGNYVKSYGEYETNGEDRSFKYDKFNMYSNPSWSHSSC